MGSGAAQIPFKIETKPCWSTGDEAVLKHSTVDQSAWLFHEGKKEYRIMGDKGINSTKTEAWTTLNTWSSLEGKCDVIWFLLEHWNLEDISESCL